MFAFTPIRALLIPLTLAALVAASAGADEVLVDKPAFVGTGLQTKARLLLDAPNPGSLTVALDISSFSIGDCALAKERDHLSADSITVVLNDPQRRESFWVRGLAGAVGSSCFIDVAVVDDPLNPDDNSWQAEQSNFPVPIKDSVLRLRRLQSSLTTGHPGDRFRVAIGVEDTSGNNTRFVTQNIVGGPCSVQVCSDNGAVLNVRGEDGVVGTCGTAEIGIDRHSTQNASFASVPAGSEGSATLTASQCADVNASKLVTVSSEALALRGPGHLGIDLQDEWALRLSSPANGSLNALVEVTDLLPNCAISADRSSVGASSVLIPVADGLSRVSVYIQGLSDGECNVDFSLVGYESGATTLNVEAAGVRIVRLDRGYTLASGNDRDEDFQVVLGVARHTQRGIRKAQKVRPGVTSVDVDLEVDDALVALLEQPAGSAGAATVSVSIPTNSDRSLPGELGLQAIGNGPTVVTAVVDDGSLVPPSDSVKIRVAALRAALHGPDNLGAGLEFSYALRTNKRMASATILELKVTGSDCTLWDPAAAQAATQIDVTVPQGRRKAAFTLLGAEGVVDGACPIEWKRLSGDLVDPGNDEIEVTAGKLQIRALARSLRLPGSNDDFIVRVSNEKGRAQPIRRDFSNMMGLLVKVCSVNETAIKLSYQGSTPTKCVDAYVAAETFQTRRGDLEAAPELAGDSNITAEATGFEGDDRDVTVKDGTVNLIGPNEVGRDLQDTFRVRMNPRPSSNITITLTAAPVNGGDVCYLSSDPGTLGGLSLPVTVEAGKATQTFTVQGIDELIPGEGSPCVITAVPSSTSWGNGEATVQIVTPGLRLRNVPSSTFIGDNDNNFSIQTGIPEDSERNLKRTQPVHPIAGQTGLLVTACSDDPTRLLINGAACDSQEIPVNEDQTADDAFSLDPQQPDADGVEVDSRRTGFVTTSRGGIRNVVILPGYTIQAPYVNRIGTGLTEIFRIKTPGNQASDRDFLVTSETPALCLLSPDTTTVGTLSLVVTISKGTSKENFYVHALERLPMPNVGSPCNLMVTSAGLPDSDASFQVVPAAAKLAYLKSNIDDDANPDPFKVVVGIEKTQNDGDVVVQRNQKVRPIAGQSGSLVGVCSSDALVGQLDLHDGNSPAVCKQVLIEAGKDHSLTSGSTNAARLEFLPQLGGGVTIIEIDPATSDFDVFAVDDGSKPVNVISDLETITLDPVNVGDGLVTPVQIEVSEGDNGLTVWFVSLDDDKCKVASTATGAGGSIVPLGVSGTGVQSVTGWVQGVGEGACRLTAAAAHQDYPQIADETITVGKPAIRNLGLPSALIIGGTVHFDIEIGIADDGSGAFAAQAVQQGGSFDIDTAVDDGTLADLTSGGTTATSLALTFNGGGSAIDVALNAAMLLGTVTVNSTAATPGELIETAQASTAVNVTGGCGLGFEFAPLLGMWALGRRRRQQR